MFSSDKILQEILYLLELNGNRLNLLKLMKELYLIDRLSIAQRDTSLSGDQYFSLPHGPVLSATLNMLSNLKWTTWNNFLSSEPANYYQDIVLKQKKEYDLLSKKDKEYIKNISDEFKDYTPKEIEDYTHDLPEWVDPKGSSKKIRYQDIMLALGRTEQEIKEAKEEYEFLCGLAYDA